MDFFVFGFGTQFLCSGTQFLCSGTQLMKNIIFIRSDHRSAVCDGLQTDSDAPEHSSIAKTIMENFFEKGLDKR